VISDAPIAGRSGAIAVWSGAEVIVWGGLIDCCAIDSTIHESDAAAYDPAADKWRRLADVPSPWSGDGGPAITAVFDAKMVVYRGERIARFDPVANRWAELPAVVPPEVPTGEPACGMTGGPALIGALAADQLYIWTGGCAPMRGLVHSVRPSSTAIPWRPTAPSVLQDSGSRAVAGGDSVIFLASGVPTGEDVYRYDIKANAMKKLEHPGLDIAPFASVVWTGRELLVFNGSRGIDQPRPGAIYGPPRHAG
jgi:hypothetical protein